MRVQSVIDTLCIVIGGARIRMKFSRRVFALSLSLSEMENRGSEWRGGLQSRNEYCK